MIAKVLISLGALSIMLVHIFQPELSIDYITIALFVIIFIPWFTPFFKSLELPGGTKLEFQDFQRTGEEAGETGLLSEEVETEIQEYTFQTVADDDPNLALAGLRIEIENRLRELAESKGLSSARKGAGLLLRELVDKRVITGKQRAVLEDIMGLLNKAVHGAEVDSGSADWAIDIGPRILKNLEERKTSNCEDT